jgi:hypothetical protein
MSQVSLHKGIGKIMQAFASNRRQKVCQSKRVQSAVGSHFNGLQCEVLEQRLALASGGLPDYVFDYASTARLIGTESFTAPVGKGASLYVRIGLDGPGPGFLKAEAPGLSKTPKGDVLSATLENGAKASCKFTLEDVSLLDKTGRTPGLNWDHDQLFGFQISIYTVRKLPGKPTQQNTTHYSVVRFVSALDKASGYAGTNQVPFEFTRTGSGSLHVIDIHACQRDPIAIKEVAMRGQSPGLFIGKHGGSGSNGTYAIGFLPTSKDLPTEAVSLSREVQASFAVETENSKNLHAASGTIVAVGTMIRPKRVWVDKAGFSQAVQEYSKTYSVNIGNPNEVVSKAVEAAFGGGGLLVKEQSDFVAFAARKEQADVVVSFGVNPVKTEYATTLTGENSDRVRAFQGLQAIKSNIDLASKVYYTNHRQLQWDIAVSLKGLATKSAPSVFYVRSFLEDAKKSADPRSRVIAQLSKTFVHEIGHAVGVCGHVVYSSLDLFPGPELDVMASGFDPSKSYRFSVSQPVCRLALGVGWASAFQSDQLLKSLIPEFKFDLSPKFQLIG